MEHRRLEAHRPDSGTTHERVTPSGRPPQASALPPGDLGQMRRTLVRRELIGRPIDPPADHTIRRLATCRCGTVRAICTGDPLRVSVCHCHDCQRRSGSAFAVDARFAKDRVSFDGPTQRWSARGGSGMRSTYHFCATCGSTVAYTTDTRPGQIAIPVGAFADPAFPPPTVSGWEQMQQPWVAITGDDIEHRD
ncbi:GFA family protein [Sphingomonas sp. Leaf62]|uniref:GFA family protein n=1 Tax=Sphingomonas sp. Leaf62 TaxID=1736228 RepID=UPI000AFE0BC3|nr:GFA family protein [Sphingomonas sp. Leaf62]